MTLFALLTKTLAMYWIENMKQFLLFMGDQYYPSKAWNDFVGDFDTLEDALKETEESSKDWYQIVDIETGQIVSSANLN